MGLKPRIKLPDTIKTGDTIEIRALVHHVMETGNRKDDSGQTIPRNIVHSFKAVFEGQPVFSADFGSGIAANPFIAFYMKVSGPGELVFTWEDDSGATTTEKVRLEVHGEGQ